MNSNKINSRKLLVLIFIVFALFMGVVFTSAKSLISILPKASEKCGTSQVPDGCTKESGCCNQKDKCVIPKKKRVGTCQNKSNSDCARLGQSCDGWVNCCFGEGECNDAKKCSHGPYNVPTNTPKPKPPKPTNKPDNCPSGSCVSRNTCNENGGTRIYGVCSAGKVCCSGL